MKKIQLLLLALLLSMPFNIWAQSTLRGDVNGDNEVNVADINAVIDIIMGVSESDWVDLGLPSGTIWATRNVGAFKAEDYGDYFAWGEIEKKSYYDLSNYKWYKSDDNDSGYTKYCCSSYDGYNEFTDGKTELDKADDAAIVNWDTNDHVIMPTYVQIQELVDNCTWQWTQRNGVNGMLGTGPNGNTIFFPAAGFRDTRSSVQQAGEQCLYWSRTLYFRTYGAHHMSLSAGSQGYNYMRRHEGLTIRPVRAPQVLLP